MCGRSGACILNAPCHFHTFQPYQHASNRIALPEFYWFWFIAISMLMNGFWMALICVDNHVQYCAIHCNPIYQSMNPGIQSAMSAMYRTLCLFADSADSLAADPASKSSYVHQVAHWHDVTCWRYSKLWTGGFCARDLVARVKGTCYCKKWAFTS